MKDLCTKRPRFGRRGFISMSQGEKVDAANAALSERDDAYFIRIAGPYRI